MDDENKDVSHDESEKTLSTRKSSTEPTSSGIETQSSEERTESLDIPEFPDEASESTRSLSSPAQSTGSTSSSLEKQKDPRTSGEKRKRFAKPRDVAGSHRATKSDDLRKTIATRSLQEAALTTQGATESSACKSSDPADESPDPADESSGPADESSDPADESTSQEVTPLVLAQPANLPVINLEDLLYEPPNDPEEPGAAQAAMQLGQQVLAGNLADEQVPLQELNAGGGQQGGGQQGGGQQGGGQQGGGQQGGGQQDGNQQVAAANQQRAFNFCGIRDVNCLICWIVIFIAIGIIVSLVVWRLFFHEPPSVVTTTPDIKFTHPMVTKKKTVLPIEAPPNTNQTPLWYQ